MYKYILSFIFILSTTLKVDAQLNTNLLYHWQDTTLVGSTAYNNTYNEIWGLNINGYEFAVIGSTAGSHIFDITNPTNAYEVAFIAGAYTGPGVIHRDYHDYNGYLYIVCDEGSPSTLQIVDISDLPNSVNTVYDSNNLLNRVHNIFIDTATAKLYACATGDAMEVFSLSNPENPTLIHTYNDVGHVHDAYVINDTAFLNCGNDGLRIMDYSNVVNPGDLPIELASFTSYPDAGYNHSGWLTDDGNIYAMQDENHGYDVKILDVSDFSNPILESSLKLNPAPNGENGWSYSHSEATYEHKAFQYWEDDGLLAIPMSTSRWYQDTVEEDGKTYHHYGYEYISKLMLINATPGKSLGIYSENIDHSSYYGSRYSWDSPDIKRSIFMGGGDYIYAISEKAVTAHNVATMEKTGFTELPSNNKPIYEPYYYYEEIEEESPEKEEESSEKEETESSNEGEGEAPPDDS